MKFVSVRNAKAHFSDYLDKSQQESVVVTTYGKPKCVVIGVEGYEIEEVILMANSNFWKMIEERRKQPKTSLLTLEKSLIDQDQKHKRKLHRRRKKAA